MKGHRRIELNVWMTVLVSTIVVGYLAGHKLADWQRADPAQFEVSVRTYPLRDLLPSGTAPRRDLHAILALIKQTVDPESWNEPGISAVAREENFSIVIQQTGATHSKISELLGQLRELKTTHDVQIVIDSELPMTGIVWRVPPARVSNEVAEFTRTVVKRVGNVAIASDCPLGVEPPSTSVAADRREDEWAGYAWTGQLEVP